MKIRNKFYPLYELPKITDLKDMVSRQARTCPEAEAFAFAEGREVCHKTFAAVAEDIRRAGAFLYENGLQGKHIAIVGENSYAWVVTFLAAANGGMVAVPIDKELPGNEIAALLKQSDCDAVVYSPQYAAFLEAENCPAGLASFPMEAVKAAMTEHAFSSAFDDYAIDPDATAAVFFTSGTTGACKGVMLSHRNIAADINFACKNFVLDGNTLSVLPFHHAFGLITAIFMVFHYGKPTYINQSLKRITQDMKTVSPQTIFLVPLYIETFYKEIWKQAKKTGADKRLKAALKLSGILLALGIDLRRKLFSQVLSVFGGKLEYIICGGAFLDAAYVKKFRQFGVEILNGYGITECSPVISVNRNHYRRDGSVGLVLEGCTVKISEGNEILVCGDNVSRGYYRDEKNTAAAFRGNWYATGDLGHIDKDGFLYITGRKKDLIILANGENVSPEQIEQQLLRDPAIEEIIIFAEAGKLAAEIFPAEEYMGNQEKVHSAIRAYNQTQPAYRQITSVYLRSTEFEKNTNKKVLRYKVKEAHEYV